MKKTFIFYSDRQDYLSEFTDAEAGVFLKTILKYQRGEDIGDIGNIKFIRPRVKNQLDDDNAKWEQEKKAKSKAGIDGNIKRWGDRTASQSIAPAITGSQSIAPISQSIAPAITGSQSIAPISQSIAPVAVNVNVNDNVNDNVNVNDNEISSKEDTAIAEYGNKEVNEIISILKEKVEECELIYSPDPQDRQYAKHLLSKKFSANLLQFGMTMEEFIGNIVKLSTQPYTKQVNNCKKFYYNRGDVINSSKSGMNKNKTTISHIG